MKCFLINTVIMYDKMTIVTLAHALRVNSWCYARCGTKNNVMNLHRAGRKI